MENYLGIYIHIPFCSRKCLYCDFYSLPKSEHLFQKYLHAVTRHIEETEEQISQYYVDTIYFGGGTPSYFGAKRICEILSTLKRTGQVLKSSEITVEVNPESVTLSDYEALLKEGVNRISIGVQCADSDTLQLIGRRHNFIQAEKAVKNAKKAGFKNVSIDLIYGLPSQMKKDWADTLTRSLQMQPEHVSCYGLKLEEGTPMYSYTGSPFLPDEDEQADMYLYAVETLERHGYTQYEISNFCLQGLESRHNQKYWFLDDYIGFGPSAHSCMGGYRYANISDANQYITNVLGGGAIISEYEKITGLDRASEYIMLGMRTTRGISRDGYLGIYRSDFDPLEELLNDYVKKGWAVAADGRWNFTSTGFLLSNALIGNLLEAQTDNRLLTAPWMREEIEIARADRKITAPKGVRSFSIE